MSAKEKEPSALMVAFSAVDQKTLLDAFDIAAVDRSPLRFADAVSSVADILLNNIARFETAHSDTVAKFSQLSLKLQNKYVNSPNLSDGENLLFANRQQALAQHIELGINDVKEQILSIKAQAEDISARINRINHMTNSLTELAALETERRPTFAFLVENAVRIVNNSQQRINFFIGHQKFVERIVDRWIDWNEDYRAFKTGKREEFIERCSKARIEQSMWEEWYNDWQSKRFAIEQRFLPLIEFALKGNLLSEDGAESSAEHALSILETYKYDVDDFYVLERKNIHQKFAFQAGGELQEKFEVESELYKLTERLQRSLQTVIFGCERTEERIFLLRWTEPLLKISLDELMKFIQDQKLDAISTEILDQFAELRRKNFAEYLSDSRAYGEAIAKREKEYNSLVFRMRRDLMKQGGRK